MNVRNHGSAWETSTGERELSRVTTSCLLTGNLSLVSVASVVSQVRNPSEGFQASNAANVKTGEQPSQGHSGKNALNGAAYFSGTT
jgi:hypothetical protein